MEPSSKQITLDEEQEIWNCMGVGSDVIQLELDELVKGLPKREARKVAGLWGRLDEFKKFVEANGQVIPQRVAAGLIGVSRQRIAELTAADRLTCVYFEGHPYITESSVVEFGMAERKSGRPVKNLEQPSMKAMAKVALKMAKQAVKSLD